MHDTALQIGGLFLDRYVTSGQARVLEIGALDVNGSLRQFSRPGWLYVGVDGDVGPSVNVKVSPGERLPFGDASFDAVLASSVFEHDLFFWETFLEMVRLARRGGHVYLNAPSNGSVHRYPVDNWRFYPEAGLALQKWAVKNGHDVFLMESFVARRRADAWNDFVAVFQVGLGEPPARFLFEDVAADNILRFGSTILENETRKTEDMQLLDAERKRARKYRRMLHKAREDAGG